MSSVGQCWKVLPPAPLRINIDPHGNVVLECEHDEDHGTSLKEVTEE